MRIRYFCAICGAGKTRVIARYAKHLADNGDKVLIVQKTIKLITATIGAEIGITPFSVKPFHSDNHSNVSVALSNHFKNADTRGEIVLTTHDTFAHMPFFEGKEKWHVIVDEIPQIDDIECFNLSETHAIITDRLRPAELNDNWYHLNGGDGLEALAKNANRDCLWDQLKRPVRKIAPDHWDVYAVRKDYDALISGQSAEGEETGKIEFFSAMRPTIFDGFRSVMIAGANFRRSMLYRAWSATGVEFGPLPPFMKKFLRKEFRSEKHENGALLRIHYAYDANWSKHQRNQPVALTSGETVDRKANIIRVIGELMGDEDFAFMANKDWARSDFASWKNAVRLSGSPHGDNSYLGLHNIAILSALNPTPNRGSFLEEILGLGKDDIREALYCDPVYQAVCRISVRNPDDTSAKRVVVMDHAMAIWLSEMFPGSEITKLDMGEGTRPETRGRKKSDTPSPAAIKKRNQRAKRTAQAASAI